MSRQAMAGQVQTVRGAVNPATLGITMMHEHFFVDLRRIFSEPSDPDEKAMAHAPMSLDNLSYAVMNWSGNLDNLVLDNPELITAEAMRFAKAGGGTIVDVTTGEFGRDPQALRTISDRTGLHVVMGCGHYHAMFHPATLAEMSEDAIADSIVQDIQEGVGDSGIRAGIIGEVGCSWPMHPDEAKSLRASARAQRETGAALTIHPGRHIDSPFEIIDILQRGGAEISRVVMGHMERTGLDQTRLLRLARTGCVLEWDWFGEVRPAYPHGRVDVPSDGERIKEIRFLTSEGFVNQIVLSQDVCFKTRLAAYGGPGYAHIVKHVRKWMIALGITATDLDIMLIANPRRILTLC